MDKAIDVKLEEKGYAAMLWSVANVFPVYIPYLYDPWWRVLFLMTTTLNIIGYWRFEECRKWFLVMPFVNLFVLYFTGNLTFITGIPDIPRVMYAYWESYIYYQTHPYD